MGNSDIDLWPWLFESLQGSVIIIFVLGKDGFGVEVENFKKLNTQTQAYNLRVRLVICHDSETQARNGGQLSPIWHYSTGSLSKYYAEFWLDILAANNIGNANDHDYQVYIQELAKG